MRLRTSRRRLQKIVSVGYLLGRDRGVCAACGCDTRRLERILKHASRSLTGLPIAALGPMDELLHFAGFGCVRFHAGERLWKPYQTAPVAVSPDGMPIDQHEYLRHFVTLCAPCHATYTGSKQQHVN